MEKSKVLFTKNLTGEGLINIYEKLGVELKGNIAIKLHSGEAGNQNYLRPEFVKPLIEIYATAIPLALDDGSRLPKVYILCYTICINIWK